VKDEPYCALSATEIRAREAEQEIILHLRLVSVNSKFDSLTFDRLFISKPSFLGVMFKYATQDKAFIFEPNK